MGSRDYNRPRAADDIEVLGAISKVKCPAPSERGIFIWARLAGRVASRLEYARSDTHSRIHFPQFARPVSHLRFLAVLASAQQRPNGIRRAPDKGSSLRAEPVDESGLLVAKSFVADRS